MSFFCVITTIQEPTPAAREVADRVSSADGRLVVVGDAKGPASFDTPATDFLSLEAQLDLPWKLARALPTGHYARKNLGYLHAIRAGATVLYETDDDNAPLDAWAIRERACEAVVAGSPEGWVNVYRAFTDEHIWPRGFPLDALAPPTGRAPDGTDGEARGVESPVQQGLADGSPDVDAVWRLVLDRDFRFDRAPSVLLPSGRWCPFNSQSTWWWPEAFPLLYLPSHCSFRMTDIWRSFVAQRCLWTMEAGVVFHAAEVVQDRNEHDLMRDFEHEVPGYLGNRRLVETLEAVDLEPGADRVGTNLRRCYEALVREGFFPGDELPLVEAWLDGLREVAGS